MGYLILSMGMALPPSNFVVSCSIIIEFAVLIEFDKFFPKSSKKIMRMISAWSYDVIFCFMFSSLPLKFQNSLFLD